jgi:hypothetical protein
LSASDEDSIAIASDQHITRAGEKNHRPGVFVHRRFMGDFFDVNVKDGMDRQIDGPRMHEVALKKDFDPTTIFGNANNQTRGVLNAIDDELAVIRLITHEAPEPSASKAATSRIALPEEVRGKD